MSLTTFFFLVMAFQGSGWDCFMGSGLWLGERMDIQNEIVGGKYGCRVALYTPRFNYNEKQICSISYGIMI